MKLRAANAIRNELKQKLETSILEVEQRRTKLAEEAIKCQQLLYAAGAAKYKLKQLNQNSGTQIDKLREK